MKMLLVILLLAVYTTSSTFINQNDSRFLYEGRWLHSADSSEADWPCAAVRFAINVTKVTNESIDIRWSGVRSRMNVSVSEGMLDFSHMYSSDIVHGSSVDIPFQKPSTYSLSLANVPIGIHTVRFRKLTTSCPYGSGIGDDFLSSSHVKFYGVELPSSIIMPPPPPLPPRRKIEFIGASDTAGYCVDGEASFNFIQYGFEGWEYENCDLANTGNLGQMFQADISIPSISGIGLTQNANAAKQWIMGKKTARDYWNFTLQSSSKHFWDFSTWRPDLVYISLGGNDYNHQNGHVPSNETFTEAYEHFMLRVLNTYGNTTTKVLSVCGQGSPIEATQDPDNNRCRPCPHVESAVNSFQEKYIDLKTQVGYVFVPCDGTVVNGKNDIGCMGHKNRVGQAEVTQYLASYIRDFMNW
eukprot:g5653.t1